jgi:hypothetical protein
MVILKKKEAVLENLRKSLFLGYKHHKCFIIKTFSQGIIIISICSLVLTWG